VPPFAFTHEIGATLDRTSTLRILALQKTRRVSGQVPPFAYCALQKTRRVSAQRSTMQQCEGWHLCGHVSLHSSSVAEPDAGILHIRICGGPGQVTARVYPTPFPFWRSSLLGNGVERAAKTLNKHVFDVLLAFGHKVVRRGVEGDK